MESPPARTTRRRRILFSIITVVLLLSLLELGVRVRELVVTGKWSPSDFWWSRDQVGTLYQSHPFLVRCLTPDHRWSDETRELHVNSHGLRGGEITLEKPPGTLRVVCVGGSSTFDPNAASDAVTWPGQLQSMLAAADEGHRWEVINGGVSGYNSVQSLINFELRLQDFDPDCVVVYHGFNDIAAGKRKPFSRDYSSSIDPTILRGDERSWIRRFLEDHSLAFAKVQRAIQRRRAEKLPEETAAPVDPRAAAAYCRNLVSLAAIARARGCRVFLCSQGLIPIEQTGGTANDLAGQVQRMVRMQPAAWNEAIRLYHDATERAARESESVYVDVDGCLSHATEHFTDAVHLTEAGNRIVAEAVADAILAE